jgi:AraC-like DNA-binding protein
MLTEPVPLVFSEWFECVVARCQVFIGERIPMEFDIVEAASAFVEHLPDARCPGEDLFLRGMLLNVAYRWGESLHNDLHRTDRMACGFDATSTLRALLSSARGNEKRGFLEWAQRFRTELYRVHPVSPARRAAVLVRERTGIRLDAAGLATMLGVSPRHLRRAFVATFGVPLPEYVRRARVLRALEAMAAEPRKVESVALDVGYRSKKDFYRAFRQLAGMTPTAFMKLAPQSAGDLIDRMRLTLI